jgi:hypothetical protein
MTEISQQLVKHVRRGLCLFVLAASSAALASEYHGTVTYHGLPVPGATVTVSQAGKKLSTVTDTQGFYSFPSLTDGAATLQVQMTGFSPLAQTITIAPNPPNPTPANWELTLLPLAALTMDQATILPRRTGEPPKTQTSQTLAMLPAASADEIAQRATDGLLVNGSVNNAATSRFTLAPHFGNTASGKSLYTFSANMKLDNSALDARSYSLTGVDTPKPETSQITGGFALQGPLKIPNLLRNGPTIFIGYQRTRNSVAVTTPGLVPDMAECRGAAGRTLQSSHRTALSRQQNPRQSAGSGLAEFVSATKLFWQRAVQLPDSVGYRYTPGLLELERQQEHRSQ